MADHKIIIENRNSYHITNQKKGILNYVALKIIQFYRSIISPLIGNNCRFYPSCSSYAWYAFRYLSFPKAFFLTVYRIMRCNPFFKGGIDYIRSIPIRLQNNKFYSKKK